MCHKCILEYIDLHKRGKCAKPFPVLCSGDCRLAPKDATEDEFKVFSIENPVSWTETELEDPEVVGKPFCFRWYQSDMVGCTARFKAIRAGRRIGKSIAAIVRFLHRMFIKKTRVLVIAPDEPKITAIFGAIDTFLAGSPMLKNSVKSRTKNPDVIKLKNGSVARGFVINSQTGTKPDKIRGQGAEILYIDETDFIPKGDFKPIYAIIVDNPNTELWMTSTPSGKREHFWRACNEKNLGYKEFYYPGMVSPVWTKEVEEYLKLQLTRQEYQHEILAEWGEVNQGVYPKEAIDHAIQLYTYSECIRSDDNLYALGIDWNGSDIGVHGSVVEYDPKTGIFKLIDRFVSNEPTFTQIRAVEKIVEYNKKWQPHLIWADAGFGGSQLEMLQKYAIENPSSKMLGKIRGVNMKASEEIPDPLTGGLRKKMTKTLMVDLTIRQIENFRCVFPQLEDEVHGLVDQLRNYTIVRYSNSGDPVYSQGEEHALTAWQVAVYAIIMTYSDIKTGALTNPILSAPSLLSEKHAMPLQETGASLVIEDRLLKAMRADILRKKIHPRDIPTSPRVMNTGPAPRRLGREAVGQRESFGKRGSF